MIKYDVLCKMEGQSVKSLRYEVFISDERSNCLRKMVICVFFFFDDYSYYGCCVWLVFIWVVVCYFVIKLVGKAKEKFGVLVIHKLKPLLKTGCLLADDDNDETRVIAFYQVHHIGTTRL